jgi:hypothetical protein
MQVHRGEAVPIREKVVTHLPSTIPFLVDIPTHYFFHFYGSFNGKLRDELLNLEIFARLFEAQVLIEN